MARWKAKIKDTRVRELCERNNISLMRFAYDMGVTLQTVYKWQGGVTPYPAESAEAMEAAKRATGEYPVAGPSVADQLYRKRREAMLRARACRRPDWQAEAAKSHKQTSIRAARINACKRAYEEVAAAELASTGRVLHWLRFYRFSHKRTDGQPGFYYEGENQFYYFE